MKTPRARSPSSSLKPSAPDSGGSWLERSRRFATSRYPATRVSVLEDLTQGDEQARRDAADLLVTAYRGPVLATLEIKWRLSQADAEDVAQEFFASFIQKRWVDRFDRSKARFRTFLRVCLDRFAARQIEHGKRLKRGGGAVSVGLDEATEIADDGDATADARFRQEWIKSIFDLALAGLRSEAEASGRQVHVLVFEEYDVAGDTDRPTYGALAHRHGLSEVQVMNHLAWARRRFRAHALSTLRRLAGGEGEFRDDVRDLLGIDQP